MISAFDAIDTVDLDVAAVVVPSDNKPSSAIRALEYTSHRHVCAIHDRRQAVDDAEEERLSSECFALIDGNIVRGLCLCVVLSLH